MIKIQNILLSLFAGFFLSTSIVHAAPPEQVRLSASENLGIATDTPMGGVAKLVLTRSDFTVGCTGRLLSSAMGDYVLTTANCLTDEFGNNVFVTGSATFAGVYEEESIPITSVDIHPDWDGSIIRGNDIAILTLTHSPAVEINRYNIDKSRRAAVGFISRNISDDLLSLSAQRNATHRYEAAADTLFNELDLRAGRDSISNSLLQYDFNDDILTTLGELDSLIGEHVDDALIAIHASWIDSVTGGIGVQRKQNIIVGSHY